jgi:succinate dehydrogenase / fumarate reductase, cytochrome b subunit
MVVSILHRATGLALSFAGLGMLAWWLFALASAEDYAKFEGFIGWTAFHVQWVKLILIGISWSFFQHLLSGIRHLVMDTGAAFELGVNKTFAILTIVGSVLLSALLWFYLLGVAK